MIVGEHIRLKNISFLENRERKSVRDERERLYIIAPEESESSLENYEEDFDYSAYLMELSEVHKQKILQHERYQQDQFFEGIHSEEPGILMEEDYRRCIREVAIRLHQNYVLEDTMRYCVALGTKKSLSSFYTGVMLRVISDKIKEELVPEVLEILMGRFTCLSEEYGKVLLSLIAHDINNMKSSLAIIKRFLTLLILSLPKYGHLEDMKYTDNIIALYHKIFLDLKDDTESIKNITTPLLLEELLALLDADVVGLRDQHSIIEILSIMACNSRIISHALMTKRAVMKLAQFSGIYGVERFEAGTIKMDIATLIWAVLPSLPKQDYFNDYEVISKNYRLPKWQKEVCEGIWVPFPPSMNFLLEQKYRRITEFNFIEAGKIHSVDYDAMRVTNQATLEQKSITRHYSGCFKVLNMTKLKEKSEKKRDVVSNSFIRFAFSFYCNRLNYVHSNSPEEYRCWQGLFTLFKSVRRQQYVQFLKKGHERLKGVSIAERVRIILNGNNHNLKIIAIRFASRLMDLNPQSITRMFKQNGMMSTIHLISKQQDEVPNNLDHPDLLQGNSTCYMKKKCLVNLAKEFIMKHRVEEVLVDQAEIHPLHHMLEILMSTPTDTKQESACRSRTLKFFLYYLTEKNGRTNLTGRLRRFLHVFAGINPDSKPENFKTSNELFLRLLKKLQRIVRDSIDFRSLKWGEVTQPAILNAGLETIRVIAEKHINVCLSMDTRPNHTSYRKLKIKPFTVMQYIEWSVLHVWPSIHRQVNPFGGNGFEFNFFLNENRIPSRITIYEAICRFGNVSGDKLFDVEYNITCKRINQSEDQKNRWLPHPLERHLRGETNFKDIHVDLQRAMNLIGVLFALNEYWPSLYSEQKQEHRYIVDPKIFEIYEMSIYAEVACLDLFDVLVGRSPSWIECILENCPFLLDFHTRKQAFRVLSLDRRTSFDTVMKKFIDGQQISNYSYLDIKRNDVLNDVNEALRSNSPHDKWKVHFDNEVGYGVGLERELFTVASRNLQKYEHGMWSTSYIDDTGYISNETGLYPAISVDMHQKKDYQFVLSSLEQKFETVGLLLGKALIDEHLLDLPLARPVFMWILKRENELTFDDIQYINPSVHKVLKDIQKMVEEHHDSNASSAEIEQTIASYDLNFVVPGHDDIELIPGGADIQVTLKNANNYIEKLQQFLLNVGVKNQMNALRRGLKCMVELEHLQIFRPEELRTLICGKDNGKNWSVRNLRKWIRIEGFNSNELAVVEDLFEIISSLSAKKRRRFLEFVTGRANLPVGGFRNLSPPLTIARSEESYPRAQTCFHALYLPVNMSKSKLGQFVELAITEGLGYFGLA